MAGPIIQKEWYSSNTRCSKMKTNALGPIHYAFCKKLYVFSYLWCRVCGCPTDFLVENTRAGTLQCQTKIGYFDVSLCVHKDIFHLEIPIIN